MASNYQHHHFTQKEIIEILDDFNSIYLLNGLERIPYPVWRKIRQSKDGIIVVVRENLLFFYKATEMIGNEAYEKDGLIEQFDILKSDFAAWFYDKTEMLFVNDLVINVNAVKTNNPYYDRNSLSLTINDGLTSSSSGLATIDDSSYYYDTTTNKSYDYKTITYDTTTNGSYDYNTTINNTNDNKKENEIMKGFNFDFGPCTNDNVRMSMYGLAAKNNNGEWVSYNPSTKQIVNVDILNFDGRKFMFKMPVAIKDIAVGDIIVHNRVPMFVIGTDNEGDVITAIDVKAGEEKKILPTTSPFGFNFVTKVVSMFNMFENTPAPDAPFGNFLPFMMMGEDNDINPFVMYMMMNGTQIDNPMMMYLLAKDSGADKDFVLPILMMNSMTKK